MAPVNTAVGRLRRDYKGGRNAVYIVDILPAQAVTVLFLHGAGDQNGHILRDQTQILHDPGPVYGGNDAPQLVGSTPAADLGIRFKALVGIEVPVASGADAYGVDMGIKGDDPAALAHIAQHVALTVDDHPVKTHVLHLFGDAADMPLLLAAFAGNADKLPQEPGHGR